MKRHERAATPQTIGALFEMYRKATDRNRSWSEQRRIFEKEVLPVWRARHVQEITRADIRALIYRKVERAPIMANRLLARVLEAIQLRCRTRLDPTQSCPAHSQARC